MHINYTKHAAVRAQQRGIPPLIDEFLDMYGREEYDGRGAVILYFDKCSIKAMERDLGRRLVARLAEWWNSYKVRSLDGLTITIGSLRGRIRRR